MSYTITAVPPAYSSLQGDLIYTVAYPEHTSDSTTYPNYKFIGDVYIDGVLAARIKKIQDPTTSIGVFNIGQIVRNYLATVFNPTAGAVIAQTLGDGQFNLSIVMKFGEEYGFNAFLNLLTDSSRVFFNNYNGRLIGNTSSLTAVVNKIASNRPTIGTTFLTSAYNLIPYFPSTTGSVSIVVTPTGGGSGYSTSIVPAHAFDLQIINVAPGALNAAHAGTITAATTSYTVQIGGQVYTFKIICEPMYRPFMLHFLNQYGGFDSKIFSKVSRTSYDITKTDYGRLPYTVGSDGSVSYKNANGVYNETRSTYASQYVEKMELNSDLLTDAEYVWLRDLILSPLIYIEDSGYFFPCVITDTSYELKKVVNDDLTNLAINIEYGNQLNAQYR